MTTTDTRFDLTARTKELHERDVVIDDVVYHPINPTTVERRELRRSLRDNRRANRKADKLEQDLQKAEEAEEYDKVDGLQAQIDGLEDEAEQHWLEFMAGQLRDGEGKNPPVDALGGLDPQVHTELLKWLAGRVEEDEPDPTTTTSTATTPG